MKKLWTMMHDYQEINVAEKGIAFAEEGFTQLFDETVKAGLEHIVDVRNATGKGILIGAAGVGLTWLGVAGINKFRKRRKLNVDKNGDPIKVPKRVKEHEPEVSRVDESIENAKEISNKNRKALANIIDEINDHGKIH